MDIVEKVFELLKTKFTGVDNTLLRRIAEKKCEGKTDEKEAQTVADAISFSDVMNSYADSRVGEATKTAIKNYEKKFNIKDGKTLETPPKDPPKPADPPKEPTMAELIANAVSAAVKPLSDKIVSFETEKNVKTRETQILDKAKEYGIPEKYAKRCAIKDDEDLDVYFKDLKQDFADSGTIIGAPETAEQKVEKENEAIAAAINKGTDEIVNERSK